MAGHGAKFGRKMEAAIAALLTQRNVEEAAKAVGVAANTLLRWLKDPEFDAAYREARRAAYSQSIARLQQASGTAVSALFKVLVESGTPASARVRAAECILERAHRGIELEDLETRIAKLELVQDRKR
jgi:transposase-like protein